MKHEFLLMKGLVERLNQFFRENQRIQIQKILIEENKLIIYYTEQEKKFWRKWKRTKRFKRRYLAVNLGKRWRTAEEYAYKRRVSMETLKEFQSVSKSIHVAIYEILD